MPDHDPTVLPVKRMNYYQYQFLNVADFTAEQDYHRAMRYRHNRSLHSRGIGEGLDVSPKSNQLAVEISPGLAIDGEGREMVVLPPGKDVTLTGLTGDVNIVLEYQAQEDDPVTSTGTPGNTRINEDPHAFGTQQAPTGDQILLATVSIAGGVVANVDTTVRQYSSAVARADQVLSQQIKEADGASGQNTEIGSGVKTGHIQDGAVTMPKLADDAVSSGKIAPADGTTAQDVNNGSGVKTGHIQDGAITGGKIADASVPGAKLTDLSVAGGKLIDNTVNGAKLVDNTVNGSKLVDNTVNGSKLVDNSTPGAKLADNSVAGAKLQNLAVTGPKVADNAIPGTKLQDATTPGTKLQDNSVAGAKLVDLTVAGSKLIDNSVPGGKLLDLSLGGGKLIDNAVPGGKLQDLTVPGGKLTDGSVAGSKLVDQSVLGTKLVDRTITQTKHALQSISLAELKAFGTPGFKQTISLTPAVVQALTSAAGYQFFSIGMGMPKTLPFPDASVTPVAASAWVDPILTIFNVTAVNPDAGVNITGLWFDWGNFRLNYSLPAGNPPQASFFGGMTATAHVPASTTITTVTTAPFPNLTVWVSWYQLYAT